MPSFFRVIYREYNQLMAITAGAVPGAFIRWQIDDYFSVNILGAAILGFLVGVQLKKKYNVLFCVGFCGALTTFSTWMVNAAELILNGSFYKVLVLLFQGFIYGLLSAAFGFCIGRLINPSRPFLLKFLFRRY